MVRSRAKAMSILLTIVLVLGLVPAPALAQMREEAMGEEPTTTQSAPVTQPVPMDDEQLAAEEPQGSNASADEGPELSVQGSDATEAVAPVPTAPVTDGGVVVEGDTPMLGDAPQATTDGDSLATQSSINYAQPQTHTKEEIRSFINDHTFNLSSEPTYATEPSISSPFAPGMLSADSTQYAINALNCMRYIAGVGSNVTNNSSHQTYAQAAALVNRVNGKLSHTPTKPEGMDDALYQTGYEGAGSSNIAYGYGKFNGATAILQYLDDLGDNNSGRAGHRRWLISSRLGQVGIGHVQNFNATYVFDRSDPSYVTDVAWPARMMPTSFIDPQAQWSLSTVTQDIGSMSSITVSVVRRRDGRVWNLSSPDVTVNEVTENGSFVGYDKNGCIVWSMPDVGGYQDGDVFDVSISGDKSTKTYSVEFFDLYSVDKVDTYLQQSNGSYELLSDDAVIEASVSPSTTNWIYFIPGFSDELPNDPGLKSLALNARNAQEITYVSSDAEIATIEPYSTHNRYFSSGPTGEKTFCDWYAKVTAKAPGTATLTATLSNGLTKSVQFHVTASLNSATITGVEDKPWTGDAITQAPTVTLNGKELVEGTDYTLSYRNNTNVGQATMTVTGIGDYNGSKSASFSITKASISTAQITGLEGCTFNGSAQTPSPIVTLNGKTLQANTDYTLSYANNVDAGTDTATVTVTGKGNCTGSTSTTFTILPAAITSVTPQMASFVYDGEEKQPAVTVMAGSMTVPESGYDVQYTSNVNVGTATVTVTGKGNYSGSQSATFEITKAQSSVSAQAVSSTVTCTYSPNASYTFDTSNLSVSGAHGGVTYSNDSTGTTAKKFGIDSLTGFATVPQGTPAGTYDLRVSVSDAGDANHNGGTTYASYSVKVDPASIAGVTLSAIAEQTYTGSGITPKPKVTLGELVLVEGTDFNFSYDNNVYAGTALIWVLGMGNYQGQSSSSQFSIGRKSVTVTANNASKEYGSEDPELTATVSGTVGADTVEYTLSRDDGQDAGTYTITPSGKAIQGNYNVTFVGGTFTITQASISDAQIAPIEAQLRTGDSIEPQPEVKIGDKVLEKGSDYTLSYTNNVEVGTAIVTVTGKGNYTGSTSANFRIAAGRLQDMRASLGKSRYTISEAPAEPSVSVVDPATEQELEEETDYTVEYRDNAKVGTAKVVLTGAGNYVGTVELEFEITKDPSDLAASAAAESVSCASGASVASNVKVMGAAGSVSYENDSDDATAATFTVDAGTGAVGVPSDTAVGVYQMRVRVTDSGDATHEAGEVFVSYAVKVPRTFPDVPADAWFAEVVGQAVELGIIGGYNDGNFGPNDPITRGQVAVVLWKMAKQPAGDKTFPDVAGDAYYHDAVAWAGAVGVVSGYKNGNFGPDDKVTREQLAAMLANYAQNVGHRTITGSADDYSAMGDADSVSPWAQTVMAWCYNNQIISGSNGLLRPQGNASRAEACKMVVFLHNMLS